MKYYRGHVFGVCETLGRWTGINAWVFRLLAIAFFSDVFTAYIITSICFSFLLEDGDVYEEEIGKKEKKQQKMLQKKQHNPLNDLVDTSKKDSVRIKGKTILKD